MAGHAHHGGIDRTGRMTRRPGRAGSPRGPEVGPLPPAVPHAGEPSGEVAEARAAEVAPDIARAPIVTQRTYRQLTDLGLSTDASANMVAYLAGLAVHRQPWTIAQVNRVLFLRQLYRHSPWGDVERSAA